MDEQRQNDMLEPTYNSSVPIQDVALKSYRKRWTIEKGGENRSGISTLLVWHDDDDEEEDFMERNNPELYVDFRKAIWYDISLSFTIEHEKLRYFKK